MRWYDPFLYDVKRYGFAIACGILAPAAFLYFTPPFVKGSDALWLIAGVFGVGLVIGGIGFWRMSRHDSRDEEVIKEELKRRLAGGEVLGTEIVATLNDDDRQIIRQLKIAAVIGLSLAFGLGLWMVYGISMAELEEYALMITATALLLFGYLIFAYSKIFDRLLNKNEKMVITGVVTNRFIKRRTGTEYLNLTVGNIDVRVFRHHYLNFHVGDRISIEVLRAFGDWNLRAEKIQ